MIEKDSEVAQTKTVVKALSLLEHLADAGKPVSISEVSKVMGMSRSTAYRLLRTLEAQGYVTESFDDSDKLQIGPKVLKLATGFLDRFEIRSIARPYLLKLRDLSHETVHLIVPHQGQILHIDKVETVQPVRAYSPIGLLEPMHCSSAGKAILAALPEAEVDAIIRQHGLVKKGPNTITDPQALKDHLQIVRSQGFAINDVENEDGIRAIGIALATYSSMPVAAISISGPAYRFTLDQAYSLAPALRNAAAGILDQMGLMHQEIN